MLQNFRPFFITLFTLLFPISQALAFKMTPMSMEIRPQGKDSKSRIFVENESKEKIAVKIYVTKRIMDESGNEERPVVADLIQVFPEQMILNPLEKRTINIAWKGDKNIKDEMAFRLVGEQLPVEIDQAGKKESANIKILLKYVAALYVTPEETNADVHVKKAEVDLKNKKFKVTITNSGNRHQVLKSPKLLITENNKNFLSIEGEKLTGMINENVLGGGTRIFSIALPKELTHKNLANLQYALELENN